MTKNSQRGLGIMIVAFGFSAAIAHANEDNPFFYDYGRIDAEAMPAELQCYAPDGSVAGVIEVTEASSTQANVELRTNNLSNTCPNGGLCRGITGQRSDVVRPGGSKSWNASLPTVAVIYYWCIG